jgi:penicillin-binding protein 1A
VRAFSDAVTSAATAILHQNVLSGTGVAANYGCPAAGKTGTTDNFTDAWFDGFTPHMSTVVWVGYPKGKIPMTNVHGISVAGGTFPAQIWHNYMQVATKGDCTDFAKPTSTISYQPFTGRYLASSASVSNAPSQPQTTPNPNPKPAGPTGPGGIAAPTTPAPTTQTPKLIVPPQTQVAPPQVVLPQAPSGVGGGAAAPTR